MFFCCLLRGHYPATALQYYVYVLNIELPTVSKKRLNADHEVEVLLDKDYKDNLILESDFSKSRGSEGYKSPETAVITEISNEATPIPSPVCVCLFHLYG
jgi:hypothetical protein